MRRPVLVGVAAACAVLCVPLVGQQSSAAVTSQASFTEATTVLEGADRRPQTSLNGDWHTIVDPYFTGLYIFHH